MTDIFLSYSSEDRDRVRAVREALVAMGYDVFWDRETPAGQNWDLWIRGVLARSKVVVVFWSKAAGLSPYVNHEVAVANEEDKLVNVLLEKMRAIDFPLGSFTTQAPQLMDWNGQAAHEEYASLLRAIRTRLNANVGQVEELIRRGEAADIAALQLRASGGDAVAQAELGFRYRRALGVKGDPERALLLWVQSASRGNARGQRGLGYMYMTGEGGVQINDQEAVRLFQLAADQDDSGAQNNLGLMWHQGRGVAEPDEHQAVHWWQKSAAKGNPSALCSLGIMYAGGKGGLERDEQHAARLYLRASDLGSGEGSNNLAEMHERGAGGLPQDLTIARQLYKVAVEQGYEKAKLALERLRGLT